MRIRPGPRNPYRIVYSEYFEAAWFRGIQEQFAFAHEVLDQLEWSLERSPAAEGESCAAFPDRDIRLTVTARTGRYPSLRFLFEIRDREVAIWHVCEAD
jgi:hypothetical protein